MGEDNTPAATAGDTAISLHDSTGTLDLQGVSPYGTYATQGQPGIPPILPFNLRSLTRLTSAAGGSYQADLLGTDTNEFGVEFCYSPTGNPLKANLLTNGTPEVNGWSIYVKDNLVYATCGTSIVRNNSFIHLPIHIALVRTGGVTTLYVNGQSNNTWVQGSATAPVAAPSGRFTLAGSNSSNLLDELRYFTVTPGTFTLTDLLGFAPQIRVAVVGSVPLGGKAVAGEKNLELDLGSQGTGSYNDVYIQAGSWPGYNQTGKLVISSVEISGPDAADFQIPSNYIPLILQDWGGFFPVAFQPSSPGQKSATITILSNDPVYGHFEIHLTGNAVAAPTLQVSSGAAALVNEGIAQTFPPVAPGSTGEEKIVTLRNGGLTDLHLSKVAFTGSDAAGFAISSPPAATVLAPGASTTFGMKFTPGHAGEFHARLRIDSDAPNAPQFYIPVSATGTGPVLSLSGPANETLASHSIIAWGSTSQDHYADLAGISNALDIAAGQEFLAVLRSDGTVAVSGGSLNGQSIRDFIDRPANVPAGLSGVKAIAAGGDHVLALNTDGTVVAWGGNSYGQTDVPSGLNDVIAISAGYYYSFALRSDGTVVSWGRSPYAAAIAAPVTGATALSSSDSGVLALTTDGIVHSFDQGQQQTVPAEVGHLTSAEAGDTFLGLRSDGSTVRWTSDGTVTESPFPMTASPIVGIAARIYLNAALRGDGSVALISTSNTAFFDELTEPAGNRFVSAIRAGFYQFAEIYDSQVDFGTHPSGQASAPQTFTLTNSGSATLNLGAATLTGTAAANFVLDDSAVTTSLEPGATTTLTVTFSPAASGISRATLQIPSNDPGHPSFTVRLVGKSYSGPYEGWKLGYFNTTDSTGDAADDADPNHNGIPNLLEYVLGGDPSGNTTGRSILPSFSQDGAAHFSISHDPSRTDAKTIVQGSDTLDDGSWVDLASSTGGAAYLALAPGVECHTSADPDHPGLQRVEITETPAASGQPHRFLRLQASRP